MTNKPNNNFIIIGLTGPTGAGKTTAASAMSDLGCFIIDSDKIARDVLNQYFGMNVATTEINESITAVPFVEQIR